MRSNVALLLFGVSSAFLFLACGLDEAGMCLFQQGDAGCGGDMNDGGDAGVPDSSVQNDAGQDATDEADGGDAGSDSNDAGDGGDSVDSALDGGSDADAGPVCGSSGTVVFDSSMPCYKVCLFDGSKCVSAPQSSTNDATCQTGICANTPMSGYQDVVWVEEISNNALFTTAPNPLSFKARCSSYTSAMPPTRDQVLAELSLTGWFGANASNVSTSYTLSAPSCAGTAVTYRIQY